MVSMRVRVVPVLSWMLKLGRCQVRHVKMGQLGDALCLSSQADRGSLPRGKELITGCQGRPPWDYVRLIMGCLGEEPKVWKENDYHVVSFWPCFVRDQWNLACLLNKLDFYFPG